MNGIVLPHLNGLPRWLIGAWTAVLVAAVASPAFAEAESLKEGAKRAGHAAGSVVHDIGHAAKQVGREIGQGAKQAGKAVGQAAKEGGKEFRRAVKDERR